MKEENLLVLLKRVGEKGVFRILALGGLIGILLLIIGLMIINSLHIIITPLP